MDTNGKNRIMFGEEKEGGSGGGTDTRATLRTVATSYEPGGGTLSKLKDLDISKKQLYLWVNNTPSATNANL